MTARSIETLQLIHRRLSKLLDFLRRVVSCSYCRYLTMVTHEYIAVLVQEAWFGNLFHGLVQETLVQETSGKPLVQETLVQETSAETLVQASPVQETSGKPVSRGVHFSRFLNREWSLVS